MHLTTTQSLEELKEWPKEIVDKLFELVQNHRVLYDSKDPQWTNKTLKGQLWNTIAKELDPKLTSRRCRDKFVTLKKRHVSLLKKQMANGENDINRSLLWLLDQSDEDQQKLSLQFIEEDKENFSSQGLQRILDEINSCQQLEDQDMDKDEPCTSETLEELIERVKASTCNQPLQVTVTGVPGNTSGTTTNMNHTESSEASDCDPPMKKQKRKNPAPKRVPAEVLPKRTASNPQFDLVTAMSTIQDQKNVDDECTLTGRLVELDLRKLGNQNRARARVAIMQIISDLITKEYDESRTTQLK